MITKDNAWLYPEACEKAKLDGEQAVRDGFIKVPDWFPVPTKGYDYKIFGQMDAYMKPKPKLRHVIRYKYKGLWRQRQNDRRMRKLCNRIQGQG